MKYLYKKSSCNENVFIQEGIDIEIYRPTIGRLILKGEKKSIKILAVRIMFWILTFGKAKLYCFRKDGELVHTSYVIPKCHKFPFLSKDEFEIGPCMTYPKFRSKG